MFFLLLLLLLWWLQRGVHVDQPAGGGGGAGGLRAGGPGPGSHGDQGGAGGALPDRGRRRGDGHRRHPHQLPRREAAHAPARRLPGRPAGPHLRGLQHVAPPGGPTWRWMRDLSRRMQRRSAPETERVEPELWGRVCGTTGGRRRLFCPEFRLSGSTFSQARWDSHSAWEEVQSPPVQSKKVKVRLCRSFTEKRQGGGRRGQSLT